jgi:lipopolysaccharide transport system permease protein
MALANRTLQRKIDLLYLLTRKEIMLKYKRTTLGIFWSVLNPLLTALVFFLAFKIVMRFNVDNYPFFLLSALFPWTWFASSIVISSRAMVDNVMLIKKVIFPRHYLVMAVILAQLVHLIFSIPILLGLSFLTGGGPSMSWLIGIPLLIVIQLILTFGVSLVVSISNTHFRDIEYLIGVLLNLLFWTTPITYPLSAVPERLHPLFMANPITGIIFAWRELLVHNVILWKMVGFSLLTALVLLGVGLLVFKKMEQKLDEVL